MGASEVEDEAGGREGIILKFSSGSFGTLRSSNLPSISSSYGEQILQNQSLRYATHQLTTAIGIVATRAHQRERVKSASRPKAAKTIQKIFFCI